MGLMMTGNDKRRASLGAVAIDRGQIHFRSEDYGCCDLNAKDVILIGEYTTEEGPWIEDHFVVLVTKDWVFEIPVGAKGRDSLLKEIAQMMETEISLKLLFSTNFASRIIAPASLEGKLLYQFEDVKLPFWRRLFSFPRVARTLSPDVMNFLKSTD